MTQEQLDVLRFEAATRIASARPIPPDGLRESEVRGILAIVDLLAQRCGLFKNPRT